MYAVIETGGKQYEVAVDAVLDVELIETDAAGTVQFDRVLLVKKGDEVLVGAPVVPGASVKATLVSEVKGPKVVAFKYKQRKRERRKVGHRQRYSRIKITEIVA